MYRHIDCFYSLRIRTVAMISYLADDFQSEFTKFNFHWYFSFPISQKLKIVNESICDLVERFQ